MRALLVVRRTTVGIWNTMTATDFNQVVIFSFPRAGTKLISKIFGQFGYHEHGEWFDTYSTAIDTDHSAKRIVSAKQTHMQQFCRTQPDAARYYHLNATLERFDQFPCQEQKSVLTLWPENLESCAFILHRLAGALWVLPQRDPYTQLVSFMVAHNNQNFNVAGINQPVTIEKWLFRLCYWKLKRTQRTQAWIAQHFDCVTVPFDLLISGDFTGFGKPYTVTSADENTDLYSLVQNPDEARAWFDEFENDFECNNQFIESRPFEHGE